jgi:hypothetical protein
MPTSHDQQAFIEKAKLVYEDCLRAKLEASDFGKVIALEPESGDYVLGKDFMDVFKAKRAKFGEKYVYIFRVGGGGAVRIGGAYLNGRLSRRNQW